MAPSYSPLLTPEQQKRFEMFQSLNPMRPDRTLTYEEFLAARGINPQQQAQQGAQGNKLIQGLIGAGAKGLGKEIMPSLSGLFGGGSSAAASAIPTQFPGLFAQTALPSMAPGIGSSAATSAASAGAGVGSGALSALGTGAALASPFIIGTILDQTLFKSKPKRQFNASEIAKDNAGKPTHLDKQIKGYGNMDEGTRAALLNNIKGTGANLIALPGYADKAGNTKKRGSEFINWSRYLNPNNSIYGRGDREQTRRGKWSEGTASDVPTVDDINNAHWLTAKKKDELKAALELVNNAGNAGKSPSPMTTLPLTAGGTPMPRGGIRDAMLLVGRDGEPFQIGSASPLGGMPAQQQQPIMINRSQTRSPGIDLNGNIINYNKKRR